MTNLCLECCAPIRWDKKLCKKCMKKKEELPTEETLERSFALYELDCEQWDSEIYLGELERLYSFRERLNKLIAMMQNRILDDLKR